MTQDDIFNQLTSVFHEVFDNEDIVLTRELSAGDVEEWDSLTHIRLIVAVEQAFSVTFQSMEVGDLRDVGDMVDSLQQKLG